MRGAHLRTNTSLHLEVPFTEQSQGRPGWAPSLGTPKGQTLLCPNGCLRGKAGQRALPTEGQLLQIHTESKQVRKQIWSIRLGQNSGKLAHRKTNHCNYIKIDRSMHLSAVLAIIGLVYSLSFLAFGFFDPTTVLMPFQPGKLFSWLQALVSMLADLLSNLNPKIIHLHPFLWAFNTALQ